MAIRGYQRDSRRRRPGSSVIPPTTFAEEAEALMAKARS